MDIIGAARALMGHESVCIDNFVFRVHYKYTVVILVAFSLLVTSRQYIGDPIECHFIASFPPHFADTHCWIHSTYSLPEKFYSRIGVNMPLPDVSSLTSKSDKVKYQQYYQFVWLVLLFQAGCCYAPSLLWRTWEDKRIKQLIKDINYPMISFNVQQERIQRIAQYCSVTFRKNKLYAFGFVVCEMLNFINTVGQLIFMDVFIGFGFPKVTACSIWKFSIAGQPVMHEGICLLPQNLINEKIFFFQRFWFMCLAVISGVSLIYRIATVFGPQVRMYLLHAKSPLSEQRHVDRIAQQTEYGDWFLLSLLRKNLEPLLYRELILELHNVIDNAGRVALPYVEEV